MLELNLVIETKQRKLIDRFKFEIESPEFAVAVGGVLEENGIKKPGKNWVEFDSKEGRPRFVIDIAPKGLGDTDAIKRIIEKVKPEKIMYQMTGGDDYGRTGSLIIPTSDERIFLKASIYISDVELNGYRDSDSYFERIEN